MAMPNRDEIMAYWLCPAEPVRTDCVALIDNLASRFDAPTFEPHVTIQVVGADAQNPEAVLEDVVKGRGSFQLLVRRLEYSDKFTKTLFVQFEPDAKLSRLSEDLGYASVSRNDYELNPHLSLLYKHLDEETKVALAQSIRLPFRGVCFDSVKAVISPEKIESRADVEAWRVVATRQLPA
jgi:2'-5' RNA ligase